MTIERPVLIWRDNKIPVSDHFDDPYFSLENGLNETRHVFLSGNDLPQRFCDGFHIAELGFGTGLNALTSLLEWRATGQSGILRFTSFEAYPMAPKDMMHSANFLNYIPSSTNSRPYGMTCGQTEHSCARIFT